MNFDFSEEEKIIKGEARRFLAEHCPPSLIRGVMEGKTPARELWRSIIELGWAGVVVPEAYGGLGMGYAALCAIAEECGRALLPAAFSSSVYGAIQAVLIGGSDQQKANYLPRLVAGELVGTVYAPVFPIAASNSRALRYRAGLIDGIIPVVADGIDADILIVSAVEGSVAGLYIVDLRQAGVGASPIETIDPSRPHARIVLSGVRAEPLAAVPGAVAIPRLHAGVAILTAFEQIGGADLCLENACAYSQIRHAFNRPIGSFQAIKHKLADIYVKNELARSNAYFGAMALEADSADLELASACARVAAIEAYEYAASESLQVHGGIGFTWEADCHLHLRRSCLLASTWGPLHLWQDRLFAALPADAA